MKKLTILVLTLVLAGNALATINFSADARVRPRMAQTASYNADGDQTLSASDIYWLYRARIFANAKLDNGFFWAAKLGHEGVADWSKMGVYASNQADWMLAYFGRKTDGHSWMLGRYPCKGNLLMDAHFYPTSPVGIPFLLFHNLSLTGAKASFNVGPGTLYALYSIDANNYWIEAETESDGMVTTTNKDLATFGSGYSFAIAGHKVLAQFLYTMGEDMDPTETIDFYNPMTYGAFVYPTFGPFTLSLGGGMTSEADDAYSGMFYHAGVKAPLGPGVFNAYYNGATMDWDGNEEAFMFIWVDYAVKYGPVVFKPTVRYKKSTYADDSYDTTIFYELTTEIKVK